MKDIERRADIETLVNAFYQNVMQDDLIGHFFNTVIPLDLEVHLPVMYDFWETILLDNMIYQGNPMIKHIALHQKSPLLPHHFARWLSLWQQAVNENFSGETAKQALSRARDIAALMQHKVGTAGDVI